ncbi:MAG: methylmalonyl-CoA epimerase [Gemmatimonadetes bacterium]|jgi:methylmalonyl-CoA/ethylmalonyl-CoA epimerase|nr:methylmalonyl-CoA epimerase [Gemmatimonadota bacterium]
MNGFPLDHVGVAVASIRDSVATFEPITGATCSSIEELPEHDVNVAFVGSIELIEPRSSASPLARFLSRRGPGIHHVAYRVPDLRATLKDLNTRGFHLIDEEPRPGARGHLVAFIHPKSTGGTLIELVQHGG